MIKTNTFKNSSDAFLTLYNTIMAQGISFDNTKALFNTGFYLLNPLDNLIEVPWRKWKKDYAEYEWQWYLSGDPSAIEIAKKAKIWYNMMDDAGNVNSNYGYQWSRNSQLDKIVDILKNKKDTRKASISIYDAKEIELYSKDTPCTYSINFTIIDNKLCMSVLMRSCDLVYGFCNDQYCFSKLQELVSNKLSIEVGWYYHFIVNLHIYKKHFNLNERL